MGKWKRDRKRERESERVRERDILHVSLTHSCESVHWLLIFPVPLFVHVKKNLGNYRFCDLGIELVAVA